MNNNHYDILKISGRAKARALKAEICDATVGMLYDEDQKLFRFKAVEECLQNMGNFELQYQPALGSRRLKEGVKKYLEQQSSYHPRRDYDIALTIGGTGALSLVAQHLQTKKIILPDIGWPNYENIFLLPKEHYLRYRYDHLESVQDSLDSLKATPGTSLLVINDPAQNPTGYSLGAKDYQALTKILNDYAKERRLVVLLDLAYIDYGESSDLPYRFADSLDDNIQVFIVFSGSKSFGIYGLRAGALLFDRNQKTSADLALLARSFYSCPPNIGFEVITRISQDEGLRSQMKVDLAESRAILERRSALLLKLLQNHAIDHLDYHQGFYLTIAGIQDAYDLTDRLERRDVFFVPLDRHHLRVAICSINMPKLEKSIAVLKEVLNEDKE